MKNNLFFAPLLAIGLSFLSTCTPSEQGQAQPMDDIESYFFNLDCYIKKELNKLAAAGEVKKIVEINGHREERLISNLDFSKELASFSDADINRLAWKDKYQVDSVFNTEGELLKIRHIALDKDMRTQFLSISFQNELVDSIFIRNEINGFATKNTKEMIYVANTGYSIKSNQQTLIGSAKHISVEVSFSNAE
ncbi:MAG: hypothetical protein ACI8YQ_002349 [Polaribacter sp.]